MSFSPNFRGNVGTSSKQLKSTFQNGIGGSMAKGLVVSTNTSGQIEPIDVSDEDSVLALVGITAEAIPSAANGYVVNGGRLEDVTTGFAIGDALYVGSNGLLTNTKPEAGVDGFVVGDFVIFVGVVVKNEFNPSNKDIQLMIAVVGQL